MSGDELTVVVVDDDFRVAAIHEAYVARVPGFRVVGRAHTAADALRLSRELQPDLVLMDVYLPDGDGLQVTRELLDGAPAPAVIVITAASDNETVEKAVRLGAFHYLVKPFGPTALAERLTAFRAQHERLGEWPAEATQDDIDTVFELRHPTAPPRPRVAVTHLAPTLRLVYDAVAASDTPLSASEVARTVGISRATAQRCLSQLENTAAVSLELRYGFTGRPEHRYSLRRP
ncbi:response regulator [Galbitalea soli]|uniref:Transcriptional regulatory protein n=1 Tax=Galbitalea soli TaxID=1268042 RepID=A0A7C9PP85_9MICO|nr:response regulator [Galbitalea soli]NEM91948.1 response regulator [Galbitalea soli]NYJ32104.1 response regulator of citrate/malate metabolism [Galbitalea soli]